MSFLGMGSMEVLLILLVAFIFLGPERMIETARTLGRAISQLRRMSAELSETWVKEEDFDLSERPIVHRYGGRGRSEGEDDGAEHDGPRPGSRDADADGPVGFRAVPAPVEETDAEAPGRETSA